MFSVASYNKPTERNLTKVHLKCARGSGGSKIRLVNEICAMALAKRISAPPEPLANF
jgi:hypothetical protein